MIPWTYIPGIAALAGGGAIFCLCKDLRRFHKFMGFTLIFEGLVLLLAGMLFSVLDIYYAPLYILYAAMLLVSPFFYYYAMRIMLKENGIDGRDLWMLSTAVMFVVIYVPVVICIPAAERNAFFDAMRGIDAKASTGAGVLMALDTTAYAIFAIEQIFIQVFCATGLFRYRKILADVYSNLEGKSIGQIRLILILMAMRLAVCIGICLIPANKAGSALIIIQAVILVLFYAVIAFYVCRIRYTAEELGRMLEKQSEKARIPIADDIIGSRLESLEKEKFFLDPDANLIDLSSKIQVNSKYVSGYLKYHFNETFLTYVNRLRIEYSTECLEGGKTSSMDEIAELSGFTNVSTFYRNFIKIKGVPPSKYRKID